MSGHVLTRRTGNTTVRGRSAVARGAARLCTISERGDVATQGAARLRGAVVRNATALGGTLSVAEKAALRRSLGVGQGARLRSSARLMGTERVRGSVGVKAGASTKKNSALPSRLLASRFLPTLPALARASLGTLNRVGLLPVS